jgi:adenylate cyclase
MPRLPSLLITVTAAVLTALLLSVLPLTRSWIEDANNRVYDSILQLHQRLTANPNLPVYDQVLIVALDDRSIDELGTASKWPSHYFADLVRRLNEGSPKLIAFDLFFADSTGYTAHARQRMLAAVEPEKRDDLERLFGLVNGDADFARAMAEAGNVFLAMFDNPHAEAGRELPAELAAWDLKPKAWLDLINPYPPLPMYAEVAYGLGFAQAEADRSGVIHGLPLFLRYRGKYYVNFSFQACLDLLGADRIDADGNIFAGRQLVRSLPLDPKGDLRLRFYPERPGFRYISFSDIIFGRVPAEYFKGKIVLVGATATGMGDQWTTPLRPQVPGVELHATFMRNLIEEDHVSRQSPYLPLLCLLALIAGFALLLHKGRPVFAIASLVLVPIGLYAGFYSLYAVKSSDLDYMAVLLPWFLASSILVYQHYSLQIRERRKVRDAFGHYVSEPVIEQILADGSALRIGGSKQPVSALITDLRNFTSWCERSDPEQVSAFLHRYFNLATELITEHKGMLDKYMGDALLALFNAPLPQPDYAYHACLAALEIKARSDVLMAREIPAEQDTGLGIAITSGEVVLGNMGSDKIFNYTGIGNTINLCSRLENLNKFYGTVVIIDQNTYEMVKGRVHWRHLDQVSVKGMHTPTYIYELREDRPPFVEIYEQALDALIRGDFVAAVTLFSKVLTLEPDDLPTLYKLKQINALDRDTWDGVLHYEHK